MSAHLAIQGALVALLTASPELAGGNVKANSVRPVPTQHSAAVVAAAAAAPIMMWFFTVADLLGCLSDEHLELTPNLPARPRGSARHIRLTQCH